MNDIDDDAADEVTLRYRRASAADPSRPADHVRAAISAQARKAMTLRSPRAADEAALAQMEASAAANDSRWNIRAVAGLAVIGLVGLIATQALRQSPAPVPPIAITASSEPAPQPQPTSRSESESRQPAAAKAADAAPVADLASSARRSSNAPSLAPIEAPRPASGAVAPAARVAAQPIVERYRAERADANSLQLATTGLASVGPSTSVSRTLEAPLKAAQQAMNVGNYDLALDLLVQAQALPGNMPYDEFVIREFMGPIFARQGRYAEAYQAFSANAESEYVTQGKAERYQVLATLAYSLKNYLEAVEFGTKAVAVAERSGQRPAEANLKLLWESFQKLNDRNGENEAAEKLLTYYPKPEYWQNAATEAIRQSAPADDRLTLQAYRLMQDVGTLKRPDQFAEMAQLAQELGLPGEAQAVLEQGMATNAFTVQSDKERAGRLLQADRRLAETSRQRLAADEQAAVSQTDGESLIAVGSRYLYDAGNPAKAAILIALGLSRGGIKSPNDAYLSLGLAQVRNRNVTEAQRAFASVTGNDAYEHLARLWLLRSR